jgi:hypothetical protein
MSMKVFDLNCDHDHRFEGWFASAEAFADQQERKLIECPACGSHAVRKIPAASRLNLSGSQAPDRPGRRPDAAPAASAAGAADTGGAERAQMNPAQMQALFMQMTRRIMETTEDVGDRFAEEARRIHYSEAPERAIRGSTSHEEAVALRDEGIEVYALPVPLALKGPLQ